MLLSIAVVAGATPSLAASRDFECAVHGHFEGDPSPGRPHGTVSQTYSGFGGTQAEAEAAAMAACRNDHALSCVSSGCESTAVAPIRPVDSMTELSCGGRDGVQVVIQIDKTAVVWQRGRLIAALAVTPLIPDDRVNPVSYSSSGDATNSLELDQVRSSPSTWNLSLYAGSVAIQEPLYCLHP
jgi:hypothetical protein